MTDTWHEHDGQSWPAEAHPEDRVEVRYRFGGHHFDRVDSIWRLDGWEWDAFPDASDIMTYRVVS